MRTVLLTILLGLFYVSQLDSSQQIIKSQKIVEKKQELSYKKKIIARITYWTHSEKGYFWGKKVASCPKAIATEGVTSAIDPRKIAYGTKIWIPQLNGRVGDGFFLADDTGSAVKKMKAIPKSKRKEVQYVIDIYVDSIDKMNKMANTMPQYMEVYLLES